MTDPARLLAGKNRLGRIEKDAIFERVIGEVAPRRSRWLWWAVPVLATAALAIVLVVPRAGGDGDGDDFTARGSADAVASFTPTCGATPCTRGGKLLFDLHGTAGYRYFAAFARGGDGAVIWYVDGKPLALRDGVFADAVVIGDEHRPGTYRVYAVFAQQPLTRDAVKALFDDGGNVRAAPGVQVVVKELAIR